MGCVRLGLECTHRARLQIKCKFDLLKVHLYYKQRAQPCENLAHILIAPWWLDYTKSEVIGYANIGQSNPYVASTIRVWQSMSATKLQTFVAICIFIYYVRVW